MVVQKSTVECTSMTVRELVLGTAPEQQDIWNSLLLARLWYASHTFSSCDFLVTHLCQDLLTLHGELLDWGSGRGE